MLMESLGQKVLHGWLQNRHQTLVPLTLNFRVLSGEQRAAVAEALAALVLAGRPRADALAASAGLREWLGRLGADADSLAAFERALAAPPALDRVIEGALALDVPVYVFVAALNASDPRFAASLLLCDVLQARFELGSAVVRSVTRRYRR